MASKSTDVLTKAAGEYAAAKAGEVITNFGNRAAGNGPKKDKSESNGDDNKGFIGHTMENIAEGGSAAGSAVKGLGSSIMDVIKNPFKGRGKTRRPTNIVEDVFVGIPPDQAFAAWTDYEEWAKFSKGITNVNVSEADEEDEDAEQETDWTAKVFLSRRSWHAKTTDFDPPNRIAWTSEGAKGTIDGTVTFTPVGENATLILVVMEYRSKGPVEWIANRWRAAGRRARLDLKHFRRYAMRTDPEELPEAWEDEEPEDSEEEYDESEDSVTESDEDEEPDDDEETETRGRS
jgi:uncharacterized membrane protein